MIKLLALSIISLSLINCGSSTSAEKTIDAKEAVVANEQTLLFDGESTKGWHLYGGGVIDTVWKIKDKVLYLDTLAKKQFNRKGGWDIITDDEFENFDLELEWMINKNGNSGIIFYINEDKQKYEWPWKTGMEMQVLDNEGHPDSKIIKHRAGDLYDLIACSKETVKKYGEWNMARIKSLNGQLELYLNGELVVATTLWDDNWKKLVAGSKFKDMPDFGTYKKGHIGLQDHGDMVSYRNIRIRKL
jgi:hypothetical protein